MPCIVPCLECRWAELEKESKERELRLLGELDGNLSEPPGVAGKGRRGGNVSGSGIGMARNSVCSLRPGLLHPVVLSWLG